MTKCYYWYLKTCELFILQNSRLKPYPMKSRHHLFIGLSSTNKNSQTMMWNNILLCSCKDLHTTFHVLSLRIKGLNLTIRQFTHYSPVLKYRFFYTVKFITIHTEEGPQSLVLWNPKRSHPLLAFLSLNFVTWLLNSLLSSTINTVPTHQHCFSHRQHFHYYNVLLLCIQ